MTEVAAHSQFSASASDRWMVCPGSIQLSKGKADKTSQYAAEGTAAHTLAAWCLQENKDAVAYMGRVIPADGFVFTVDDDMAGYVQTYIDQVREYAKDADMHLTEVQVNYASHLGVDERDGFGTSDTIIVKSAHRLLQVHDLKYGRGDEVEATDNRQMRLYALGALDYVQPMGLEITDFDRVLMVIHQPRVQTAPKEWEISVAELLEFAKEARTGAERVIDAMLEYPSPDWHERFTKADTKACKYCRAKATCVTLRSTVTNAVFDVTPATPNDFENCGTDGTTLAATALGAGNDGESEAWLAAALGKVDLIEGWCKAILAEAESRMLAGGTLPGYKLVQGKRGPRQWKDAAEAEAMLKTFRLKVEEMFDLKVISPTSAEKLAKDEKIGKRQWPKLQALITQADGKLHVAPASDKRDAVKVTPVDEEFEAAPQDETVDDLA